MSRGKAAARTGATAAFPGVDVAREFHALTSFYPGTGYPDHPRRLRAWAGPMREPRAPQFKDYPGVPRIPLPRDLPPLDLSVAEALTYRGRPDRIDATALSRLLFFSGGVMRWIERDGQVEMYRAAGSSGNLSPLELYVACGDLDGIPAGLYHYAPPEHALHLLAEGDVRGEIAAAAAMEDVPAGYVVLTAVPWRTGWKYGERGLRNVYRDSGTLLAQLLPFLGSGLGSPRLLLAFVDRAVRELLGLDPRYEFPVALVPLPGHASGRPARRRPPPAGHIGDTLYEFPLVTEAQEAGALADPAEVRAWRAAAAGLGDRRPSHPREPGASARFEETIRLRGSTRRFSDGPGPRELLEWALPIAAGPLPWDATAADRTLLRHAAAVHRVRDVRRGLYWLSGEGLVRTREEDLRDAATRLCLDQHLAGTGAYAAFHCADVREITSALGARGYRALLLETGYASGRLHLAAHALGNGASGLTFYDADLRAWLGGPDPQLVTAVGLPAYRRRPGGLPGQPTRLARVPEPRIGEPTETG